MEEEWRRNGGGGGGGGVEENRGQVRGTEPALYNPT